MILKVRENPFKQNYKYIVHNINLYYNKCIIIKIYII